MDPLDLLKAELSTNDMDHQLSCLGRLGIIARALGPEKTRTALIQYLTGVISEDHDHIRSVVAQQLNDFVPYVGGPNFNFTLFPILHKLVNMEETVVREHAIVSFQTVLRQTPDAVVADKGIAIIKDLNQSEWFGARMSACCLAPVMFPKVSTDLQALLLDMFIRLGADETQLVRKAAFTNIGAMASVMPHEQVILQLLPLIKSLATDEMDSMRILALDTCVDLMRLLTDDEKAEAVSPLLEVLHSDSSWKIRQQFAKTCPNLCRFAGDRIASSKVLPLFVNSLLDGELSVRLAATLALEEVASLAREGALQHLTPVLESLALDPSEKVRVAFSNCVAPLCALYAKINAANARKVRASGAEPHERRLR